MTNVSSMLSNKYDYFEKLYRLHDECPSPTMWCCLKMFNIALILSKSLMFFLRPRRQRTNRFSCCWNEDFKNHARLVVDSSICKSTTEKREKEWASQRAKKRLQLVYALMFTSPKKMCNKNLPRFQSCARKSTSICGRAQKWILTGASWQEKPLKPTFFLKIM